MKKRLDGYGKPKQKIGKMDCLNEALMDRITVHMNNEYNLGQCTILSKLEQQNAEIEDLK